MTGQLEQAFTIRRDVLRDRLRELCISMDEFKSTSGVDRRTLERILSGRTRRPHPATIQRICEAVGLSTQQLFGECSFSQQMVQDYRYSSPFSIGAAIPHPHYFHGRKEIIGKLAKLWRSMPMQNAAIIGHSGMGKTSLFRYLMQITDLVYRLESATDIDNRKTVPDVDWLYLDLSNPRLDKASDIYRAMLSHFKPGEDEPSEISPMEFFERMESIDTRRKTVIIFDETDVALARLVPDKPNALNNRFWEGMRYLSTLYPDNISFLLGCKQTPFSYVSRFDLSSPFFNIFGYTTQLQRLESDDAWAMFRTSETEFSADDSRWIIENSGLYPRLLQLFCWELSTILATDIDSQNWRESALAKAIHLPEFERV
jgi:transcriptional regulator with XRE-family HTH domain